MVWPASYITEIIEIGKRDDDNLYIS